MVGKHLHQIHKGSNTYKLGNKVHTLIHLSSCVTDHEFEVTTQANKQAGRQTDRRRDRFHPCAQTYAPKGAWLEPSHRISLASRFDFKLINSRPAKEMKKILSPSFAMPSV
jgi:hypothetical protein